MRTWLVWMSVVLPYVCHPFQRIDLVTLSLDGSGTIIDVFPITSSSTSPTLYLLAYYYYLTHSSFYHLSKGAHSVSTTNSNLFTQFTPSFEQECPAWTDSAGIPASFGLFWRQHLIEMKKYLSLFLVIVAFVQCALMDALEKSDVARFKSLSHRVNELPDISDK